MHIRYSLPLLFFAVWNFCAQLPLQAADIQDSSVKVGLYVDSAKNQTFVVDRDGEGFVYGSSAPSKGAINIRLDNEEIRGLIEGVETIDGGSFLNPPDFAPVFLVVDVWNADSKSHQVVGGYIAVEASAADLDPVLTIPATYLGCYDEEGPILRASFLFVDQGWGQVGDAQVEYSFGDETSTRTKSFFSKIAAQKQNNVLPVSVMEGLRLSGANLAQLATGTFKCSDWSEVPRCTDALKGSGILGALDGAVFTDGLFLLTRVSGEVQYTWIDTLGSPQQRTSPFIVDIPLVEFTIENPACGGGPGPIDRRYPSVKLSINREKYRLPLDYRAKLEPKQIERFALSLTADKASSHAFRVVLTLADGTNVTSPVADLQYFIPRDTTQPTLP